MREYEQDIEDLYERIEALELENSRLRRERTVKKSKRVKKRPVVKDEDGMIIQVGDWVKATTSGKFEYEEGEVQGWKKWVTFIDIAGVTH